MSDITNIKFEPDKTWERKRKFVVLNKKTQDVGIARLKSELESELMAFIPSKYRKYVRRYIHLYDPPKESVIGWCYVPQVNLQTGKVDS